MWVSILYRPDMREFYDDGARVNVSENGKEMLDDLREFLELNHIDARETSRTALLEAAKRFAQDGGGFFTVYHPEHGYNPGLGVYGRG